MHYNYGGDYSDPVLLRVKLNAKQNNSSSTACSFPYCMLAHTHMHARMHARKHTNTHTHTHTHVHAHIYTRHHPLT